MKQTLDRGDDYKFLGKEVAYYDGLFRLMLAIMNKIAREEDVTNLVNHLESSFPYKDKEYTEAVGEAFKLKSKKMNVKDRHNRIDLIKRNSAIREFTHIKYKLLMELFKRKKVLPQEAEESWIGVPHEKQTNDDANK